ncbi:hypothetical protein EVAR_75436_1 [Eumeta japonica]|uniref:Uncharacterized protein n=1 Tax=Eumeta variegata TaxID=151549 RepID=A0A4C1TMJ2_EUMVA|nr:hypothetical protein EVAR_75436_1 [Eumeta japonica]
MCRLFGLHISKVSDFAIIIRDEGSGINKRLQQNTLPRKQSNGVRNKSDTIKGEASGGGADVAISLSGEIQFEISAC